MRIIICGAGQVGTSIANQLSNEGNDVTVVDQSVERIQKISNALDVNAFVGFASHPDVLEQAGARETDMIIAVTMSDEVNMVACQVAHSLFRIPIKIARVRNQHYLKPHWKELYRQDHLPIDVIISPEVEVAQTVNDRLHVPGATDSIPFADGKIKVISIRCLLDCPMTHLPFYRIKQRMEGLNVSIVGIIREEHFIMPEEEEQLLSGDEIYMAVDSKHVPKVMALFGHEEKEARRIIIVGGGNIGLFLAEQLENEEHDINLKLIEIDKTRAESVAEKLNHSTVIHGSALDHEIMEEVNITNAETVIAVTNDDKVNILASLLAKRLGCQRSVTLVNNNVAYNPLIAHLGLDVIINPRETTVSSILRHIRRGRIRAVHSICNGQAEIIEADAIEASPIVGKTLEDVRLPQGIYIGAILRQGNVIIPHESTIIEAEDRIIIVSLTPMVQKVERIFSVKFEYF